MKNKITDWFESVRLRLEQKDLTQADRDKIDKAARLTMAEHADFQTLKSAMMGVMLNLEEATTLYQVLGPSADHFNQRPVHERLVCVKVYSEMVQRLAMRK